MLREQLEECLGSGPIQVSQVFSQCSGSAVSDLDGRELKRLRGIQEFGDVRMGVIREDPILKRFKFKLQDYNLGFQGFDAISKDFHGGQRLSGWSCYYIRRGIKLGELGEKYVHGINPQFLTTMKILANLS